MQTPDFFEEVPTIVLCDALAETLGAATGGVMEYRYLDAVKLAGHSCPTVAGAWLMTRLALARLYPGQMPRRGELRVELREAQEAGVAGVIAGVAGLVTGAAGPGGFHGSGRPARPARTAGIRQGDARADAGDAPGHRAQRRSLASPRGGGSVPPDWGR